MLKTFLTIVTLPLVLTGCAATVLSSDQLSTSSSAPYIDYGLPRALVTLTVKVKDHLAVASIGEKQIYIRDPDPKNNFRLVQHHSWYTNDTLDVQTDGAGLLKSISVVSENQTYAIANQALSLTNQVVSGFGQAKIESIECKRKAAAEVTYTFDPFSKDIEKVNALLVSPEIGICISISNPVPYVSADYAFGGCGSDCPANGIFYRTLRHYRMSVTDIEAASAPPSQIVFSAPDVLHTYYVPLERKWFVKFDAKLDFDRGVLTGFKSSSPSEALAALQIPGDVIKNIIGLSTASSSSSISKTK
jgi:hypothetical protein